MIVKMMADVCGGGGGGEVAAGAGGGCPGSAPEARGDRSSLLRQLFTPSSASVTATLIISHVIGNRPSIAIETTLVHVTALDDLFPTVKNIREIIKTIADSASDENGNISVGNIRNIHRSRGGVINISVSFALPTAPLLMVSSAMAAATIPATIAFVVLFAAVLALVAGAAHPNNALFGAHLSPVPALVIDLHACRSSRVHVRTLPLVPFLVGGGEGGGGGGGTTTATRIIDSIIMIPVISTAAVALTAIVVHPALHHTITTGTPEQQIIHIADGDVAIAGVVESVFLPSFLAFFSVIAMTARIDFGLLKMRARHAPPPPSWVVVNIATATDDGGRGRLRGRQAAGDAVAGLVIDAVLVVAVGVVVTMMAMRMTTDAFTPAAARSWVSAVGGPSSRPSSARGRTSCTAADAAGNCTLLTQESNDADDMRPGANAATAAAPRVHCNNLRPAQPRASAAPGIRHPRMPDPSRSLQEPDYNNASSIVLSDTEGARKSKKKSPAMQLPTNAPGAARADTWD